MQTSKQILASLLVVLTTLTNASPSRAEIAPEYYVQFQQEAPEALTIQVLKVRVKRIKYLRHIACHVTLVASVLDVTRSAKGVSRSEQVVIKYSSLIHHETVVGPAEIPILKVGMTVPAFLTFDSQRNCMRPAARGQSFSTALTENLSPDSDLN